MFVYLFMTSAISSVGGQSVIANWLSFCSKCFMASIGSLSLSSKFALIVPFHKLSVLVQLDGYVQYALGHLHLPYNYPDCPYPYHEIQGCSLRYLLFHCSEWPLCEFYGS